MKSKQIVGIRDSFFWVDEGLLGEILQVKTEGIRTVADKSPSRDFLEEARKIKN